MTSIYDWIVSFWGEDAPSAVKADDIYMEQQSTGSIHPGNRERKDEWTWVETISDDSSNSTIMIQTSRVIDGEKFRHEQTRVLRELYKQLPRSIPQPAGKLLTQRDRKTALRCSSERNELQMVRYSRGLSKVPGLAHSSDAEIVDVFLHSKPVLKFFSDLDIQQNPESTGYDIDALLTRLLEEYRKNTKAEAQPNKVMGLIEWKKDAKPEEKSIIQLCQKERMPSWIPADPSNASFDSRCEEKVTSTDRHSLKCLQIPPRMSSMNVLIRKCGDVIQDCFNEVVFIPPHHDIPKWMADLDIFDDENKNDTKKSSSHCDIPKWMVDLDVFDNEDSAHSYSSLHDIPAWMNLVDNNIETTSLHDIPDWMERIDVFEDVSPRDTISLHHDLPQWIRRMDVVEGKDGVDITSYFEIPQWIKRINVFEDEDKIGLPIPLGTEPLIDPYSCSDAREDNSKQTQLDISQDDYLPLEVDEEWFEMSKFWKISDASKQNEPTAPWDCDQFRTTKLSPSFYKCLLSDTIFADKWVTPGLAQSSGSNTDSDYLAPRDALLDGSSVSQRRKEETNNPINFGVIYDQCGNLDDNLGDFGAEWDIYEKSSHEERSNFSLEWPEYENVNMKDTSSIVDFGAEWDIFEQASRKMAYDDINFGLEWDIYEQNKETNDNSMINFGIEWDSYEREGEMETRSSTDFNYEWEYQESLMKALREFNREVEQSETHVTELLEGMGTSEEGKSKIAKRKLSRFEKSTVRSNISKQKEKRSSGMKKSIRRMRKRQKKSIQLNQPMKRF